MISVDIPVALRQMIDARLDNVERALMAQFMGRGDRQQILSAIEDQILEMLGQSAGEEPTRDDLLSVFAKLDPPEAYLEMSDRNTTELSSNRTDRNQAERNIARFTENKDQVNVFAVIGFALTCVSFPLAFVWGFLEIYGLVIFAILTIAAGICGSIALYQFIQCRRSQRGLWMALTASSSAPFVALLSWVTFWVLRYM